MNDRNSDIVNWYRELVAHSRKSTAILPSKKLTPSRIRRNEIYAQIMRMRADGESFANIASVVRLDQTACRRIWKRKMATENQSWTDEHIFI